MSSFKLNIKGKKKKNSLSQPSLKVSRHNIYTKSKSTYKKNKKKKRKQKKAKEKILVLHSSTQNTKSNKRKHPATSS